MFAVISMSAVALTSPNGKFKSVATENGIEFHICTPRGLGKPLLRIHCGLPVGTCRDKRVHKVGYDMVLGKKSHCRNAFREERYTLSDGDTLTVRLYNDGVVWKKAGVSYVEFVNPSHRWVMEWTDSYENFYPMDAEIKPDGRYAYPMLVEFDENCFGLLTESGITFQEAATSIRVSDGRFCLSPDGDCNGGWQTFVVGSLPDIVKSTLVTDNSAPALFDEISWIVPGVASWVYWAYNHGSNDLGIIKQYVDLAVRLKLPYVLIDAEWDEMKGGSTVEDAVAYALENGVRPMIWYNSSVGWIDGAPGPKFRLNRPEDREREFSWCERLGVAGVKIDFFSGDSNSNIRYMDELLRDAAKHHLMVNFHGATLPRGWQRTYPNLVSVEAVYGAEWYNNRPDLTGRAASHNATLPFTRNVVGSMDYTPCAFSDSQHPHITTHAHELALTCMFESGIQHIADRPESLLAQPEEVRDYFADLPTAWDETVLLGGYPGKYVAMARRKGGKWWISVINGTDQPIEGLHVDFSPLFKSVKKRCEVLLFEDAKDNASEKWDIRRLAYLPYKIDLLPRGGMVAVAKIY